MPYNNQFPVTYQPIYPMQNYSYQPQAQAAMPMPQGSNTIVWVQGESGAKAYPVAPNSNVLLMDSESSSFFIKSTDASGMPMPLRTFEYHEVIPAAEIVDKQMSADTAPEIDTSKFATKEDIAEIKRILDRLSNRGNHKNQQEKRD